MNRKDEFLKAQSEEFQVEEDGINIEDVELTEGLNRLLEDMYEELSGTKCEHCTYNILKSAIFIAHQIGIQDGKMDAMKAIHCSMTDCEDCDWYEE